jgi:hypothetical protein
VDLFQKLLLADLHIGRGGRSAHWRHRDGRRDPPAAVCLSECPPLGRKQQFYFYQFSVSDPGRLSLIPDPDFYLSRIPDPTITTKDEGKQISCTFFIPQISKKFKIIIFLNR